MPTYDYFCEANGRKVEVSHKMSERIATWGELCDRSAAEPGDTPAETPVRRLITGGAVISSTGSGSEPPCASGACCPSGGCGF
ncbi:MAG: zinc ribbon domain-containing protein [Chromatiaceae bacterium]|nr:zinc ribbon domain-containing protein [Gammaproteobacteria bacterium]MCP5448465.1 zinc ribbon domain-containing protein [Chromatiaceae bacterium]MCB1862880.1 zinc ribbon domain-containing protein [Gammaproteobacteria bacterium]MCB1871472.1 zinc ribbon domain-containing protein [Gammaproteobacteria bacterium]MCB1879616.1 zinc ribbon domain-containing protein [Gammaproteobacteria bacterium]